ncbi:hypothetical protein MKX08_008331 [Trichoderma sp. CBMAI-0020]|nr:hypothetical protein MKX08_008331 [Trichoderma sp. CBMAI-0020]
MMPADVGIPDEHVSSYKPITNLGIFAYIDGRKSQKHHLFVFELSDCPLWKTKEMARNREKKMMMTTGEDKSDDQNKALGEGSQAATSP